MNNLAIMLKEQGKWCEAGDLYQQAVNISKKVQGDEHPSSITNTMNLANHLRDQGNLKEAEDLEIDILEKSKMVLGTSILQI